eukprot:21111-Heterococcus_DN1.PRE.4
MNWTTAYMTQLWVALTHQARTSYSAAAHNPAAAAVHSCTHCSTLKTPSRVTAPRHDVTTRHFRRFTLYAVLVLWRTRVLYEGLKWLQWQWGGAAAPVTTCWYAGHTGRGFCRDSFDFSDHVVLFMSQYLAIQ